MIGYARIEKFSLVVEDRFYWLLTPKRVGEIISLVHSDGWVVFVYVARERGHGVPSTTGLRVPFVQFFFVKSFSISN